MDSHILSIAAQLRWGTALTIFPYDNLTGIVMVEAHSFEKEDIRTRKEFSQIELESLRPTLEEKIIEQLVEEVEHLTKMVDEGKFNRPDSQV